MSIPFYRYVEYLDDGHSLYQCLQCGTKIDVGEWFEPNFCWDCGVKFKGMILRKQTDYISLPITNELWFQIESGYDWGEGEGVHWGPTWRGHHNAHQAIKYLKKAREEREEENKRIIKQTGKEGYKFRVTAQIKEKSHGAVIIDTAKYYKKTGKKFDKKIRERHMNGNKR
jgi:hypothetical protein